MKHVRFLLVLVFFIGNSVIQAQSSTELFPTKTASFVVSPDDSQIELDLLTFLSSISVSDTDTLVSSRHWTYNRNTSVLTLNWPATWPPFPREIQVSWQYRPLTLPRRFELIEPLARLDDPSNADLGRTVIPSQVEQFTPSNLSGSGSITRGVIVGTNRDLGIESGLRFDLTGYITDDVFITASITDQNTFIQPDGTTQNLRDFDQVFIRLEAPQIQAQFGDIDTRLNASQIARLNRRLQGAQGRYQHYNQDKSAATTALAVIRGTFRTVTFAGRDGNQGPYRLTNAANEPFIVVVAGTERVYLDGRLLNRGDENDYVIDYSMGEIYFTNRRIIRNTHRIRVEYQYLSSGYTRTLAAAETDYHNLWNGRMSIGATFIREADNIAVDEFTGLSEADLELLRNTQNGDGDLFTSGADSVGFRPDSPFILYTRRDTLINGEAVSIFLYQPGNPLSAYRVQFTRVGEGQGSYQRSTQSVNGIIYEWVGQGLGSYEPIRRIQSPEMQQLFTLRASIRPIKGLTLGSEVGVSSREANRYATMNNVNGQMITSSLRWQGILFESANLNVWAKHDYKGESFAFFDPVRDVEFSRQWDIPIDLSSSEQLGEAGLRLELDHERYVNWVIQHLNRSDRTGYRNDIEIGWSTTVGADLQIRVGQLQSERAGAGRTRWQNAQAETGWRIGQSTYAFRPYYSIDAEFREETDVNGQLNRSSFGHIEHASGLQFELTDNVSASLKYGIRTDYEVYQNEFTAGSHTFSPEIDLVVTRVSGFSSRNRVAYQTRRPTETFEFERGVTRGLAVRSTSDLQLFNRALETSILYDVSTESRSILQETYLEVGPELGQFVWIDINGDGIPQLDEFFPEQTPNEGTYIRQLLPTDDLKPVVALQFRWRLVLDPFRMLPTWYTHGVRYSATVDIREQSETRGLRDVYLLQQSGFRSDKTLSGRISTDQQLQLFRHRTDLNVLMRYSLSQGLNRLASGVETENTSNINFFTSYRFAEFYTAQFSLESNELTLESSGIASRNYDITILEAEPGMLFTFEGNRRIGAFISLIQGQDTGTINVATLRGYRFRTELMLPVSTGINFTVNSAFRNMRLNGQTSATSEFVLTKGAGTGDSWLWGLQLMWRVSAQVRTTVEYNGRTINNARTIQTGRVTVSATF